MKAAEHPFHWVKTLVVYSLAGSLSSSMVGALIGWFGDALVPHHTVVWSTGVVLIVAVVTMVRELGWITMPLPQLHRQTKDIWAKIFPRNVAAALWGFDLGLIFSTWLTFSGVWLLASVTFMLGDEQFGVLIFVTYWLGRVLSVWLLPLLMQNAAATPDILADLTRQHWLLQRTHALGLGWAVIVLGTLLFEVTIL